MRPDDLARELRINPKTLRAWLRRSYPRSPVDHGSAWFLTDQQVKSARAHFGGSPPRAEREMRVTPTPAACPPSAPVAERISAIVRSLTMQPTPVRTVVAPRERGVYAWWIAEDQLPVGQPAIPSCRPSNAPVGWSLLYVGIAPRRPSDRTMFDRFHKDHRAGNIGGSTFRQSLAALLRKELDLRPKVGSDRSRLVDEEPLSRWMNRHLGITFAIDPQPWQVEPEVIAVLSPPLNLDRGTHPFRSQVEAARDDLWTACGLPPRSRAARR